jgi:hypothetical protein
MTKLLSAMFFGVVALPSTAVATDITLLFGNSGGPISSLQIVDTVCNRTRYDGHFAANDGKQIDGFCVNDASNLVTNIRISRDGSENTLSNVVANSTVDVFTWRVTPP